MRVPVWVADWQYQCCGEAFTVGDAVAWQLAVDEEDWLGRALGDHAPAWAAALPVLGRMVSGAATGAVVGAGGLRVYVPGDDTDPAPGGDPAGVRRVRLLVEDHHAGVPEEVPATRGTVRAVRLVRLRYRLDEAGKVWLPVPGDVAVEHVHAAPHWPEEEVEGRGFAGFLVDLDVADGG